MLEGKDSFMARFYIAIQVNLFSVLYLSSYHNNYYYVALLQLTELIRDLATRPD